MRNTRTYQSIGRSINPVLIVLSLWVVVGVHEAITDYLKDRYQDAVLTQDGRVKYGVMPFDQVTVTSAQLSDRGLDIEGLMRKLQCDYDGMTAYTLQRDGTVRRVRIDSSPEDVISGSTGSRPAVDALQHWGVWRIMPSVGGDPVGWSIYVRHTGCPKGPTVQTNLFAEGPWPQNTGE